MSCCSLGSEGWFGFSVVFMPMESIFFVANLRDNGWSFLFKPIIEMFLNCTVINNLPIVWHYYVEHMLLGPKLFVEYFGSQYCGFCSQTFFYLSLSLDTKLGRPTVSNNERQLLTEHCLYIHTAYHSINSSNLTDTVLHFLDCAKCKLQLALLFSIWSY